MKKTKQASKVASPPEVELNRKQFLSAFAALAVYSAPAFLALSCGGGDDDDDDDDCSYSASGSFSCDSGSDSIEPECEFTNDGQCDEPEGTDLCPEGTDYPDCP